MLQRISIVASTLLATACATIITGTTDVVQLRSSPSGATIEIRNERGEEIFVGTTPTTATLYKGTGFFNGADYTMQLSKPGYETRSVPLGRGMSGWYLGNVIFGGLLGILIIDPATGAMWKLERSPALSLTRSETPAAGTGTDDGDSSIMGLELGDGPLQIRHRMVPIEG